MNEFGETPSIYVWPLGHEEGQPYPDDFWTSLWDALRAAGIDGEPV